MAEEKNVVDTALEAEKEKYRLLSQVQKKSKLTELDKQIEEWQRKKKLLVDVFHEKRKEDRNVFIAYLGEDVINACGMQQEDEACESAKDFKALRKRIVEKITGWKNKPESVNVENQDSFKQLQDNLDIKNKELEKLGSELAALQKKVEDFKDVDLLEAQCLVPVAVSLCKRAGLEEALKNCKSVEDYRELYKLIFAWCDKAVGQK